jgi:hypothetical protein
MVRDLLSFPEEEFAALPPEAREALAEVLHEALTRLGVTPVVTASGEPVLLLVEIAGALGLSVEDAALLFAGPDGRNLRAGPAPVLH